MSEMTLPTQHLGKYILHDYGYGHYTITEGGRVIRDSHDFTNSEVHQYFASGLEDKPTKAQMDELATVGSDGRVVEASHHPTKSQMDDLCREPGKLMRIVLHLDWDTDPGRQCGSFDAEPGVLYTTYLDRSLDDIMTEYDLYRQEWDSSPAKVELQEHMALIVKENRITNVVSFGTGSFQDVHAVTRRHTCLQVAALLTMKECINGGRSAQHPVACLAQDPLYTDRDKAFLRSTGIEPVDDPKGFTLIDVNSVVCEWSTYDYLIRKISERPWPAVFVTGSDTLEKLGCSQDQDGDTRHAYFADLNATEAQRIYDMLSGREQLHLLALAKLMDPDMYAPNGDDSVGRHPTMFWRNSSASAGQDNVNVAIGHAL
ncbi:MAG: hypothetical protein Q9204_003357 [Flavoplaca sp. TL-2023a]